MQSDQGPFHERFFHHNSNPMENWNQCNSIVWCHSVTKFYTSHDSTAVVPSAKFHSDHLDEIRINFSSNLNYNGKINREMGHREPFHKLFMSS